VLLVRRGLILLLVVLASAVVGWAKPSAMDGAVSAWEQLAAKVGTLGA
jgi:hypothetical protein